MTSPSWLPTEDQIKAHIARQREERIRMAQRVCDGPQTILMPTGGIQSQRKGYAPPVIRPPEQREQVPERVIVIVLAIVCVVPLIVWAAMQWGSK